MVIVTKCELTSSQFPFRIKLSDMCKITKLCNIRIFDTIGLENFKYLRFCSTFRLLRHRIFRTTLQHTMQHAACSFDPFHIPWILQNLLFSQTKFWQEDFFNISNHLPDS